MAVSKRKINVAATSLKFQRRVDAIAANLHREIMEIMDSAGTQVAYLFANRKLMPSGNLPKDMTSKLEEITEDVHSRIMARLRIRIGRTLLTSQEKNNYFEAVVYAASGRKRPPGSAAKLSTALYNDEKGLTTAVNSYINRKQYGETVSSRVWKLSNYWQRVVKEKVKEAIRVGTNYKDLGKSVKDALRKYEPNQPIPKGVYKNPIDNARRLARNETNLAYADADYRRWQQIEFIIGIQVRLSNRHPKYDICDEMKGGYPKTFHFLKWHVNCLCIAIPILATEKYREELEDYKLGLSDKKPSLNYVDDIPAKATGWIQKNAGRVAGWSNPPYWIKANRGVYDAAKR